MLIKPVLAKSNDRTVKAKNHATSGEPELWFSNETLSGSGLFGFSFNFFIDWSSYEVSKEVWITRIATSGTDLEDLSIESILAKIVECDGEEHLRRSAKFFSNKGLTYKYIIFQDSNDWGGNPSPIVEATIDEDGNVSQVQRISLIDLMGSIKRLSGGPVSVGRKGLNYSTSSLEGYLSKTDSLYPGDLDQLLLNEDGEAVAVLEYKKHTLDNAIQRQTLSNYYPTPDARKYDRIAMLRDHIDPELPIIIVYYPTKSHISSLKLELIDGSRGSLKSVKTNIVPLPTKDSIQTYQTVLNAILTMI
ncbi:hypothetical protein [Paenibacillus sp. Y412MC10]|uniref:hypothetical protein n=1 Tax=Geobacillus sp. (strain Y412MC10) TaxID=481743 RepID=UPI0011A8834C|nr:hypothetical protein [Paenibacillus sp. Y412MC10]